MSQTFFEQLDAHTKGVSADLILDLGKPVARIVFRHPRNGEGRLYAYVQVWGVTDGSARASAAGFGYDKKSEAVRKALRALVARAKPLPGDRDAASVLTRLGNVSTREELRYLDALHFAGFTAQYVI